MTSVFAAVGRGGPRWGGSIVPVFPSQTAARVAANKKATEKWCTPASD